MKRAIQELTCLVGTLGGDIERGEQAVQRCRSEFEREKAALTRARKDLEETEALLDRLVNSYGEPR